MTEHRIPAANWHVELAAALRGAQPGDTIIVNSAAKAELAKIAAQRMGRQHLHIECRDGAAV